MRDRALAALGLSSDAARASLAGHRNPWSNWAHAVLLMAEGSYRDAFATFTVLAGDRAFAPTVGSARDPGPGGARAPAPGSARGAALAADEELSGMAAAALASGLRQLDEHAAAVAWDDRALASSGIAAVDGWIGRAADEVGLGRADRGAAYLDRAAPLVDGWRARTRMEWVRTEIALLQGDVATAETHARRALAEAEDAESPRHVVKSRLFLAVARRSTKPQASAAELRQALAEAMAMRLRPLVWPAVVVLGGDATPQERAAGGEAVRHITAQLPEGYGLQWCRRRAISDLISVPQPR